MNAGGILIAILIIIIAIILSPIWVPIWLYFHAADELDRLRFKRYLAAHEGAKFFCYTSRQTSVDYVKEKILPNLPPDVQVIYLHDSKGVLSLGDDFPFLEDLVRAMKHEGIPRGFPYAAKIVAGKVISISLNQLLYSALVRGADADTINRKTARFFSH